MKVIVAGSRTVRNSRFVDAAIEASGFVITELVSGGARGPDEHGEVWAIQRGIPVKQFRAAWGYHGKVAGMLRNTEMAEYAEALIAVWDGKSKGTKHMIWTAEKKKLKVFVYNVANDGKPYHLPELTTGDYS